MKLVVDANSDRVLGAHMVGEHAADIIQSLAVAIRNRATKQDLDATIGIHPTTGEEFLTLD
jgi:glutathione reductase (NADPH)